MPTLAVIWRAAGLLLATDVDSIIEILPPLACRPAPHAPAWIRGVFIYRGELIPLIDAERLLAGNAPARPGQMSNRVIAIRLSAPGQTPERRAGLWVESILELDRIEFASQEASPGFAAGAARFLGPIATTRHGLVQLVRSGELFTPDQLAVLTRETSGAGA